MSTKEAMQQYFRLRRDLADGGLDFLFKTPVIDETNNSIIFEGEIDEDEYVSWKPVEKKVSHDFKQLKEEFGIEFHKTIIEYFNSYWFAELDGFINNHYIKLESVLPSIELSSFQEILKGYKKNHGDRLENIPIGLEGNGLLVVIKNKCGKVYLEDFQRGTFDIITENIQELILNLKLKR